VSTTENANIKTWYSYDELGRVKWMIQKPKALSRVFILEYEYDFLGNVLKVAQRSVEGGAQRERFYHHYEYDRDKRLTKAYTSLDGVNRTLQASYLFYVHGPLKRIELATNLQGIDFVYNIHGWLTQINHPNDSHVNNDPGKDSPVSNGMRKDVFGMLLDYYERSLSPSGVTSMQTPEQYHKIPSLDGVMNPNMEVALSIDPISLYKSSMRQVMTSFQEFGAGNRETGRMD
ncbi:MAG: hypothetical protein ACK5XL_12715, partial [Cyclobacteriaceae bacterium]